jgi:hypothetical protein
LRGGRVRTIAGRFSSLGELLVGLNRLVNAYQTKVRIERTNAAALNDVVTAFPSAAGLLVFPGFDGEDLVEGGSGGRLRAGGLTRFMVSPRALRVNYPLEALAAPGSRETKEQALIGWVRQKVASRGVRFYGEATYLFDE